MRVVIAKKLLSSVGGSEIQARLLGAALAARGHDVTLVGLRPAWQRPGIPPHVHRSRGTVTHHDGAVRYVFVRPRLGRLGAAIDGVLPTSLPGVGALVDALAGADVVHVIAREWAAPLERGARRAGAAFVETPLVHPGQLFSGGGRGDVARYRRADALIALTDWEAAWYRARGASRVHVTGVGPAIEGDLSGEDLNVAPDPATVLFVGRKERYKGYHALRAAAEIVWRERSDARFVAIGQAAWRDRFARPPSDARWLELGVVDERRKAEAYARATVLAMPSEHETFGHAYLEAWAAGRPVIAGDIPPLREVVREGIDGLHARNDARDVARAILAIISDPDLARRMGEAGRARLLERWTWPLIAERTELAYAAALEARSS
jgi:glycosyltransferase involved in cell wall biosynthesis